MNSGCIKRAKGVFPIETTSYQGSSSLNLQLLCSGFPVFVVHQILSADNS